MPDWTYLGVPIDSVGRSGGTEHAPAAFRSHTRPDDPWAADDAGDLDVRIRGDVRDADSGVIAIDDVLAMTRVVADAVASLTGENRAPFVMGGCCSLVPAVLAGAQRSLGDVGLVYLDGHLDLYDGKTSPTGEAADMPISVVLGRGPASWVDAVGASTGRRPRLARRSARPGGSPDVRASPSGRHRRLDPYRRRHDPGAWRVDGRDVCGARCRRGRGVLGAPGCRCARPARVPRDRLSDGRRTRDGGAHRPPSTAADRRRRVSACRSGASTPTRIRMAPTARRSPIPSAPRCLTEPRRTPMQHRASLAVKPCGYPSGP